MATSSDESEDSIALHEAKFEDANALNANSFVLWEMLTSPWCLDEFGIRINDSNVIAGVLFYGSEESSGWNVILRSCYCDEVVLSGLHIRFGPRLHIKELDDFVNTLPVKANIMLAVSRNRTLVITEINEEQQPAPVHRGGYRKRKIESFAADCSKRRCRCRDSEASDDDRDSNSDGIEKEKQESCDHDASSDEEGGGMADEELLRGIDDQLPTRPATPGKLPAEFEEEEASSSYSDSCSSPSSSSASCSSSSGSGSGSSSSSSGSSSSSDETDAIYVEEVEEDEYVEEDDDEQMAEVEVEHMAVVDALPVDAPAPGTPPRCDCISCPSDMSWYSSSSSSGDETNANHVDEDMAVQEDVLQMQQQSSAHEVPARYDYCSPSGMDSSSYDVHEDAAPEPRGCARKGGA